MRFEIHCDVLHAVTYVSVCRMRLAGVCSPACTRYAGSWATMHPTMTVTRSACGFQRPASTQVSEMRNSGRGLHVVYVVFDLFNGLLCLLHELKKKEWLCVAVCVPCCSVAMSGPCMCITSITAHGRTTYHILVDSECAPDLPEACP